VTIAPIVVRLFEPISFIFPQASAAMPPGATVPLPICVLCEGLASPPSRMGWLQTPERQAIFVCCGACSDCSDEALEAKILAKISDTRASTDAEAAHEVQATWAEKAAQDWVKPATAQREQSPPAA
jgi:hypothetical protein